MPLIVLTGVNGFIGNNLCEKILSATSDELGFACRKKINFSNFDNTKNPNAIEVLGCDVSESLNRTTAKRFVGSARYRYCDYKDLFSTLDALSQRPDIIIHNGACSSTTETDQTIFDTLNLEYSKKIWSYCTTNDIPLIYASSAAVYGNGQNGFSDRKEDCNKYTPLNLYGKSKLDFDLWALEQKKTPNSWLGLRYFNVFGPYEDHKKSQASMVYHGYTQAKETGIIKLFESNSEKYDNGEQQRDFVYINDIINITIQLVKFAIRRKSGLCEMTLPNNGLFLNIGSGIANTWNKLAVSIFDALELEPSIEYIPIPENIAHQYQNYTCADLSLLMSMVSDYNFAVFEDSVKQYVQSFLARGMS